MIYRVYISDGLYQAFGSYKCRYYNIITNTMPEPEPQKTEDEIVAEIMEKGGLRFKE